MIEEILDALEVIVESDEALEPKELEATVLVVGHSDTQKSSRCRTLRLSGQIGKVGVLLLVDSGNVGTFISAQLADKLQLPLTPCNPTQFMTANGSPMICSQQITHLQWTVQGHSFISTAGVLPLKCFDMILGQDWLETCSPMWVHWSDKILKFTHHGQRITLHGLKKDMRQCAAISAHGLQSLIKHQM